jgi:hypothetical protein
MEVTPSIPGAGETAVLPFTPKKKRHYREGYITDNMFTPSFNRAKPSIIIMLKPPRGITASIFSSIKEAININKKGKSLTKNKIIS